MRKRVALSLFGFVLTCLVMMLLLSRSLMNLLEDSELMWDSDLDLD